MKTLPLIAGCSLLACSLFGQFPNDRNLQRVVPAYGPVSGGTIVTIESDLVSGTADPCIGPRVFVGGVAAEVLRYDATSIQFVTPPYTAGTFDVGVEWCGPRGAMKNAFTYTNDGTAWERVLLPVFLAADTPGAFGSIWRTELAGYNNITAAIVRSRPDVECGPQDAACYGGVTEGRFTVDVTTDRHQPGRLLYIAHPAGAKRIQLDLRVRDVSREAASLGTELHPVFEDDAYGPDDSFVLLNVPLGEPYRQKLRIYRLDVGAPSSVNAFFDDDGKYLGTRQIELSSELMYGGFLLYPGYAELDLDRLPELAGHQKTSLLLSVPQGRYWAFVSVTNNVTQQVTHIVP